MHKIKAKFEFDKGFLKKLLKTSSSGVTIKKSHHHLVAHPLHLNNFKDSIKNILNEGIAKYHENLGGILMGYQDIHLLNDRGIIHSDTPGIHLDLEANFYIFQPKLGTQLKGIVNRKSKGHIGVLVYSSFNVSIPKPQTNDEWLGASVNIGDEVLFSIRDFDISSFLPYIRGEIISIETKHENLMFNTTEDNGLPEDINLKPKKGKKRYFSETQLDESLETEYVEKKKKKKKKERQQSTDEIFDSTSSKLDLNGFLDQSSEEAKVKKSKKRKKEKDQEVDITVNDLDLNELINLSDEVSPKKKSKKKNMARPSL